MNPDIKNWGPVIGIDDFREFIGPIAQHLTRAELIAANGDIGPRC